jgi:peptidoglycan/LPS O-acetylase OafA/YrhL
MAKQLIFAVKSVTRQPRAEEPGLVNQQLPSMKINGGMTENHKAHFTDLDGMRGVLACVVMLMHLGLNKLVSKLTGGIIDHGAWGLCVDFFFILSGFVLGYSFQSRRPSFDNFAAKRVRRLAPVFLITTAIMLFLSPTITSGWTDIANLFMIQSLIGVPSINFPGWSIPFELFIPLVGLLLWATLIQIPREGLTICLCTGGLAAVLLAMDIDIPMLRAASGLGTGFCLFLVRQGLSPVRQRPFLTLALFFTNMLIMALAAKIPLLAAMFYPASAVSILFGSQVRTILSTRPFQALGRWSYSIYLLHVPVLTLAISFVGEQTVSGNIPAKVAVIAATIGAAGAMYKFVEKPIMASKLGLRPVNYAASR